MLETCDALYVPKFGLAKDGEVLRYIQQHTEKQVIQIHVGEISTMGGTMNCLTCIVRVIYCLQNEKD